MPAWLDPALAFDAFAGHRPLASPEYRRKLTLVVAPGEILEASLRAGDLLLYRGLGDARLAGVLPLASGETLGGAASCTLPAVFVQVQGGRYVNLAELDGRVHPDRMVLRLRQPRAAGADRGVPRSRPKAAEFRQVAARGTSRREPPSGGRKPVAPSTQPLLLQGTAPHASIQAAVSDAQRRLNAFLAQHQAGVLACRPGDPQTESYVRDCVRRLEEAGELPLSVDGQFGPQTALATRAFQACMGVERNGRIGPITWPLLRAESGSVRTRSAAARSPRHVPTRGPSR
ncbi:MAG: peptidoglycan-binding protein [Polyangiaceae bacterium]|nr:peptidoglycan-binding protein [Polyangiaceae bacterium]